MDGIYDAKSEGKDDRQRSKSARNYGGGPDSG